VQAELRALREGNARLEQRLERFESWAQLREQPGRAPAGVGRTGSQTREVELPTLTVVKVKPRTDPAPKVNVAVPVVEPSPTAVEEILQAAPAKRAAEESSQGSDGDFAEGEAALKTGNVSGGIAKLQKFAAEHPRHPKADNALYLSGVGLLGQANYEGASGTFERLVAVYPASDTAQEAMLRLAECRLRLKRPAEARAWYQRVVRDFPGSAEAAQASQRLNSIPP
jgi:TolA-binding protein